MTFSFNLEDYKSTFAGEVIESEIRTNTNAAPDKQNQFWSMTIVHLHKENGEWNYLPGKCLFEVNGNATCPLRQYPRNNPAEIQRADAMTKLADTFHSHQSIWSSIAPQSQAFKMITSIREKGKFIISEAKDLLGKRYLWEEVVEKGYNRKTDGKLITPHYFYVAGELDASTSIESIGPEDELPWPDMTPQAQAAPIAPGEPIAAPSNGNGNGAEQLTQDDFDRMVALTINGMNDDEAKVAIRNEPLLYGNIPFRLIFIRGEFAKSAIEKGYLERTPEGVYVIKA
jgi:hypothetical protein